jgi:hypothetical protein
METDVGRMARVHVQDTSANNVGTEVPPQKVGLGEGGIPLNAVRNQRSAKPISNRFR